MAGRFAKGTKLYMGDDDSPENFVLVAHVKSITGPGYNVTIIDTTTHDTVGNFREKAAVLIDAGQLTFNLNFNPDETTHDPTTANSMLGVLQNLQERYWELRLATGSNPGAEKMSFRGYVTSHSMNFPVDNVQEASITVEIDGAVTWS